MEALVIIGSVFIVYYITLALTQSDGAWGLMARIREIPALKDFGLLECFLCTSAWVSLVVSLILFDDWLFMTLAIAGAATALHRLMIK